MWADAVSYEEKLSGNQENLLIEGETAVSAHCGERQLYITSHQKTIKGFCLCFHNYQLHHSQFVERSGRERPLG